MVPPLIKQLIQWANHIVDFSLWLIFPMDTVLVGGPWGGDPLFPRGLRCLVSIVTLPKSNLLRKKIKKQTSRTPNQLSYVYICSPT